MGVATASWLYDSVLLVWSMSALASIECGVLFFFFSSRRRHTRFDCDWSSDVCSSDLLIVDGSDARGWLNTMLTNNIEKLEVGQGQYTFLLNERGGIIDDLIAYRIDEIGRASCRERV